MVKVMAKSLHNKKVMGTDGSEMGTLFTITCDLRTGELNDLMVKPDMTLNVDNYRMEEDCVLMPFSSVRAIKDYIVVDKKASIQ